MKQTKNTESQTKKNQPGHIAAGTYLKEVKNVEVV